MTDSAAQASTQTASQVQARRDIPAHQCQAAAIFKVLADLGSTPASTGPGCYAVP